MIHKHEYINIQEKRGHGKYEQTMQNYAQTIEAQLLGPFWQTLEKKIFGLNIFFMFRLYIQKDRAQYSADFKHHLFWKTRLPQMYYVGIYDDLILSLTCQGVQCLHFKLYLNILTLIWDPSESYVAFITAPDGWKKIFMLNPMINLKINHRRDIYLDCLLVSPLVHCDFWVVLCLRD